MPKKLRTIMGCRCNYCGDYIDDSDMVYYFEYKGYALGTFCSIQCRNSYDHGNYDMNDLPVWDPNSGAERGLAGQIGDAIDRNCFITTATCKSKNLPDDCHELTVLRKFRDEFMGKDSKMKTEVMEYYDIAPKICSTIDKLDNSDEVYDDIWKKHLKPAVDAIDRKENEKAHDIYKSMVLELKKKYL